MSDLHQIAKDLAREKRKNPTPAEKYFWHRCKAKKIFALKFRRQHIFHYTDLNNVKGFYIVDFYCHKHRLAIEIDGAYHADKTQFILDTDRENLIAGLFEMYFLRFTNETILKNFKEVENIIRSFLLSAHAHMPSEDSVKND